MKAVFADTFYFLALVNPTDHAHDWAIYITTQIDSGIVTSAWVLTEVADALAAPWNRGLFIRLFDSLKINSEVVIIPPDEDLFTEGVNLYRGRRDKTWSLTDCISFVVMKREGITVALTKDKHFEQAGFTLIQE